MILHVNPSGAECKFSRKSTWKQAVQRARASPEVKRVLFIDADQIVRSDVKDPRPREGRGGGRKTRRRCDVSEKAMNIPIKSQPSPFVGDII